jgi:hypothetical protein
MSGGAFNYLQFRLSEVVDIIEKEIETNHITKKGFEYPKDFNEKTIEEFKTGIQVIKAAQIYMQRIDWLLSGDDSEDSFHQRLEKDLKANRNE